MLGNQRIVTPKYFGNITQKLPSFQKCQDLQMQESPNFKNIKTILTILEKTGKQPTFLFSRKAKITFPTTDKRGFIQKLFPSSGLVKINTTKGEIICPIKELLFTSQQHSKLHSCVLVFEKIRSTGELKISPKLVLKIQK